MSSVVTANGNSVAGTLGGLLVSAISREPRMLTPANISKAVSDGLLRLEGFCRSPFRPDDPPFARSIDASFQEQLRVTAALQAANFYEQYVKEQGGTYDDSLAQVASMAQGAHLALSQRQALYRHWQQCARIPTIADLGSARNGVWNETQEGPVMDAIKREQCLRNLSSINGGGDGGIMFQASTRFNQQRAAHPDSASTLILVLLGFRSAPGKPPTERPFVGARPEHVSQQVLSITDRSPYLFHSGIRTVACFWTGGMGTLEEFTGDLASVNVAKILRGLPGDLQPAQMFIMNSETRFGPRFWDPLRNQLQVMTDSGVINTSRLSTRWDFIDLDEEDPNEVADRVVGVAEKIAAERQKINTVQPLDGQQKNLLYTFDDRFYQAPDFLTPTFPCDLQHPLPQFIGAQYEFQVRLMAERKLLDAMKAARGFFGMGSFDEKGAIDDCSSYIRENRALLREVFEQCANEKTLIMVGDSKTKSLCNKREIADVTRDILRSAIRQGISIVAAGHGERGYTTILRRLWFEEMKLYKREHGHAADSQFIRSQLLVDNNIDEALSSDGFKEILVPPLASLFQQTALLPMLGKPQGIVIAPGGTITMQRACAWMLAGQLHTRANMVFSPDAERPHIAFLSPATNQGNGVGYWHHLNEQFNMMVDVGTVNADELDMAKVIDFRSEGDAIAKATCKWLGIAA